MVSTITCGERHPRRRQRHRLRGGLDHGTPPVVSRAASDNDPAAATLRDTLEREWREVVRFWPAGRREQWLEDQATLWVEGGGGQAQRLVLMKPKSYESRARDCARERDRLARTVPSAAWFEGAYYDGGAFPVQGMRRGQTPVLLELTVTDADDVDRRPYVKVYAGERFTPAIAVREEERCDRISQDARVAAWQTTGWPASCSAVAIERIRMLRATESKGRRKRHQRRLTPMYLTRRDERVCVGFC